MAAKKPAASAKKKPATKIKGATHGELHAPPRKAAKKPPAPRPPGTKYKNERGTDSRRIRVTGSALETLDHPETVADWDDEELARGQRRDRNGHFTGRAPSVLPREVYLELQRRHVEKASQFFIEHAQEMAEVLADIATGEKYDEKARVAAANSLLDRALGKPGSNSKLDVSVHTPKFIQALEGAIVSVDAGGDDDIVDAEIVSDEDAA